MGRPRRSVGAGSPPRGRGKEIHFRETVSCHGITPAWAGKSKYTLGTVESAWDHPRVGGEKVTTGMTLIGNGGSPPRGRGKGGISGDCFFLPRITPAWAGKRLIKHLVQQLHGDHPRVGGEKEIHKKFTSFRLGSPPRGRGKGKGPQWALPLLGITPAWAGKRLKRSHRSGIFISGPIPFHSVLHRPAGSGGSRAGRDGSLAGQPQNAGPA